MPNSVLHIKGTSKNPEIDFKPGFLTIEGRSIPENAILFYEPIIDWIEKYLQHPEALTKVNIKIEYLNSSSNRFLYNILKMFDDAYMAGSNIVVNWYYEEDDDTMRSTGLDFQSLVSLPYRLIPIED
ncbi:MAG: DUF1987 domain-containing protein [Bacteroidales bacterium]|nr:DUF1987 domain-containing protein [Bacteroidales bacterium]